VQPSSPQLLPADRPPASQAPAPAAAPTTPEIAELERRIAAARQERQTYLEQLSSEREVHANPLFVRQRRQIAELGYALLTVEQQLDTLQAALEQAQQQLQARHAPPPQQSEIVLDQAGHDTSYWQQRMTAARERLRQAQTQRRDLLTQLAAIAGEDERIMGRQGYELLQLAPALQQVEQEIDAAEAALQAVQQEALQAGASRTWLQ
jgi:DNA repair exonuclease SbcCD ATPase subunit